MILIGNVANLGYDQNLKHNLRYVKISLTENVLLSFTWIINFHLKPMFLDTVQYII